MVAGVIAAIAWVVVVPLFVVDRDPHFLWITVVQAVAAAIVFLTIEILWVVHVRVVVHAVPVAAGGLAAP